MSASPNGWTKFYAGTTNHETNRHQDKRDVDIRHDDSDGFHVKTPAAFKELIAEDADGKKAYFGEAGAESKLVEWLKTATLPVKCMRVIYRPGTGLTVTKATGTRNIKYKPRPPEHQTFFFDFPPETQRERVEVRKRELKNGMPTIVAQWFFNYKNWDSYRETVTS